MKNRKNRRWKIVGVFFVIMLMFSSVRVVFADQDIAYMISNWINHKKAQAISEIENSISQEQSEQSDRLKSEIENAIKDAEQQFQDLIENEKLKRNQRIVDYADKLIAKYDVSVDTSSDMIQKLDCIATNAEIEMDIVIGIKDKSALKDCGELTVELGDIGSKSKEKASNQKDNTKENDMESNSIKKKGNSNNP